MRMSARESASFLAVSMIREGDNAPVSFKEKAKNIWQDNLQPIFR